MTRLLWTVLVIGSAVAGCGRNENGARSADTDSMMGHMDSGGMAGMSMGSSRLMPAMRAHMDSMVGMSPQQMQAAMAGHERMMSQMMDQMGSEMRQMKMSETREWSALTDSVKQDLAELPSLTGQALSAKLRGHADRVRRLIAAHEEMLTSMNQKR